MVSGHAGKNAQRKRHSVFAWLCDCGTRYGGAEVDLAGGMPLPGRRIDVRLAYRLNTVFDAATGEQVQNRFG